MVFDYPMEPHRRKHGPAGYTDYTSYKEWLRDEFAFRCVYCLARERWYPSGHAGFGVEHVKPKDRPAYRDLICVYDNLVYACNRCNSVKQTNLLLNPCEEAFGEHLRVHRNGKIEGLTRAGRDLIRTLKLATPAAERIRQQYLALQRLYLKLPEDPQVSALCLTAFGFPDDLPDLAALRPEANTRPEGLADCYHRQRLEGRLPATY
jgi:hypothetical protein